jgi:hypothetical protein
VLASPSAPADGLLERLLAADEVAPADVAGGVHSMAPPFLAASLARSLSELGLASVDLLYLHNPAESQLAALGRDAFMARLRAAFGFCEEARRAGRIRAYGIASWSCFRCASAKRLRLGVGCKGCIGVSGMGCFPAALALQSSPPGQQQGVAGQHEVAAARGRTVGPSEPAAGQAIGVRRPPRAAGCRRPTAATSASKPLWSWQRRSEARTTASGERRGRLDQHMCPPKSTAELPPGEASKLSGLREALLSRCRYIQLPVSAAMPEAWLQPWQEVLQGGARTSVTLEQAAAQVRPSAAPRPSPAWPLPLLSL